MPDVRSPQRSASVGLLLIIALSGAACGNPEPSASAAAPTTAHRVDVAALTVGVSDLESTLEISGSLAPRTRVAVMAKVPGTLSRLDVEVGDHVRAGQVVASLDRREIDAQVDAAVASVSVGQASVEAAEAALANATLEQQRARSLFEQGAVPKQQLDSADTVNRTSTAQRALALANLAQAEAVLRRAQEMQRDATLTSPIDGVIVERNYDAGSLVSPGDNRPVVVVADLRVLKLEAGVSELEAGRLRAGMPARVRAQARPSDVFEGRVATIAPEVDARNRHFAVEVRIENPRETLLSGMYAAATIPLERVQGVVAVPREAVITRGGRRVVLKIHNDTIAEGPVAEGLSNGTLVQIVAGLTAGDIVVADARRDVAVGSLVNAVFAQ